MRGLLISILIVLTALGALACGPAPEVVQGTVVSFDASSGALLVRDELAPNPTLTVDASRAEIGAQPAPGDLVRIAFRRTPSGLSATRIMNVSRQEELNRKGTGGH
jgi:hypothetical protein